MQTWQGRRRDDQTSPFDLEPGDYTKHHATNNAETEHWDMWFVRTPGGEQPFFLANEHHRDHNGRAHFVEEHEDGTITVVPQPDNTNSIQAPNNGWHGWIRHGVWEIP